MRVRLACWLIPGVLLGLLLSGCAGPRIDRSYQARAQDSRIQYLVLHCTEEDWETSLRLLTQGEASSHYLVRDAPVRIYRLVPDARRAYHTGAGSWQGRNALNAASLGIEIVNRGGKPAPGQAPFPDYPPAQVDAVVALVRDLVRRHGIRPDHVLAHSDLAPQRKTDPGPRFPWKRLAEAGLVPWPEPGAAAAARARFETALPDAAWFQARLAAIGYEVPRTGSFDPATRRVLAAFQMKYRPDRFDGAPDAETAGLLEAYPTPAS